MVYKISQLKLKERNYLYHGKPYPLPQARFETFKKEKIQSILSDYLKKQNTRTNIKSPCGTHPIKMNHYNSLRIPLDEG